MSWYTKCLGRNDHVETPTIAATYPDRSRGLFKPQNLILQKSTNTYIIFNRPASPHRLSEERCGCGSGYGEEQGKMRSCLFVCRLVGPRRPVLSTHSPAFCSREGESEAFGNLPLPAKSLVLLACSYARNGSSWIESLACRNSSILWQVQIIRPTEECQGSLKAVYICRWMDPVLVFSSSQQSATSFVPTTALHDVYPFATQLWLVGCTSGVCPACC